MIVTHEWKCDYCGARAPAIETQGLQPGNHILLPAYSPMGWTWVGERLVCPEHKIVVKDRGTGELA